MAATSSNAMPYKHFVNLADTLAIEPGTLGAILGINKRSLQRRAKRGQLGEAESLKTQMVHATFLFAKSVFGNDHEARAWMSSQLPALKFKRPLEVLVRLEGYERCRAILGRLAAGVY